MKTHELKILPEYFSAVILGLKTAEIRDNTDRDFNVGDFLVLREYDPESENGYTSRVTELQITHISDLSSIGLKNYVLLSLSYTPWCVK